MQNYHDTYKPLPIGEYSCCQGTWQMPAILPYIEEQQLADMYQIWTANGDHLHRYRTGMTTIPTDAARIKSSDEELSSYYQANRDVDLPE